MVRSLILFLLLISECVFPQVISLRDTTNQYDYVVITTPDLMTSCESFKQHKESLYGIKVLLVDTTMIYSEFDTANTKAGDIRDFISYAGTFWESPQPKYFLLAGNLQKIPAISQDFFLGQYPTDYYYSQSIYDPDSTTIEFYIGRVPAINNEELDNYISKLITFENDTSTGEWRNRALFIADYDPLDYFHFDSYAQTLSEVLPEYISPDFLIEADSTHPLQYRDQLINKINQQGYSSIWQIGFMTDSSLGYSNYFNLEDVNQLENTNTPFFVSFYVMPGLRTDTTRNLMDELILSQKGAIAGITTVGTSYYPIGVVIDQDYLERMYSGDTLSLGEVMDLPFSGGYYTTQKMRNNLWGDPSLKIKYDRTVGTNSHPRQSVENFHLSQNYPNPFNPVTTIKYTVPQEGNIKLAVYDPLGREVKVLVNGYSKQGDHQVVFNASSLSSGVYFYKLLQGSSVLVKKMILLK